MKSVIYLHGFNSSPQSQKAQQCGIFFREHCPDMDLLVPALPPQPAHAVSLVKSLIADLGEDKVSGIIGSSLGGYYALYFHRHYDLPAVLINPAMRPYELLMDYLGENTNLYTGERYVVRPEHMTELRQLDVSSQVDVSKLFLLTQTGDEVLDFSQGVSQLSGARMWIGFGGDHAFQHFDQTLSSIIQFFSPAH